MTLCPSLSFLPFLSFPPFVYFVMAVMVSQWCGPMPSAASLLRLKPKHSKHRPAENAAWLAGWRPSRYVQTSGRRRHISIQYRCSMRQYLPSFAMRLSSKRGCSRIEYLQRVAMLIITRSLRAVDLVDDAVYPMYRCVTQSSVKCVKLFVSSSVLRRRMQHLCHTKLIFNAPSVTHR